MVNEKYDDDDSLIEDDTTIYSKYVRDSMLEDDELSPTEEAFMNGYDEAI